MVTVVPHDRPPCPLQVSFGSIFAGASKQFAIKYMVDASQPSGADGSENVTLPIPVEVTTGAGMSGNVGGAWVVNWVGGPYSDWLSVLVIRRRNQYVYAASL